MGTISVGFEDYGKHWGNKIWLVRDLGRKAEGRKDYYCVLGLSQSGWWHLFFGTLAECRMYIRYELGEVGYEKVEQIMERRFA